MPDVPGDEPQMAAMAAGGWCGVFVQHALDPVHEDQQEAHDGQQQKSDNQHLRQPPRGIASRFPHFGAFTDPEM
ncbi:hypothetical protein [Streptomyces atriruber]|uniref:hypothetical protein n=1 Tax=Streptomyces atriruber TaxID=545121 RepID=UPI0012FEA625|nr:hypothetical protein [Streptomyces atriruber]